MPPKPVEQCDCALEKMVHINNWGPTYVDSFIYTYIYDTNRRLVEKVDSLYIDIFRVNDFFVSTHYYFYDEKNRLQYVVEGEKLNDSLYTGLLEMLDYSADSIISYKTRGEDAFTYSNNSFKGSSNDDLLVGSRKVVYLVDSQNRIKSVIDGTHETTHQYNSNGNKYKYGPDFTLHETTVLNPYNRYPLNFLGNNYSKNVVYSSQDYKVTDTTTCNYPRVVEDYEYGVQVKEEFFYNCK